MTTTSPTIAVNRVPRSRTLASLVRSLRLPNFERSPRDPLGSPSEQVLRSLPPVHSLQR